MSKRPFETEEEGEEQKRETQKIMIRVTSSSVFLTRPEIGSMIKSKQHPLTVRHFGCSSCGGGGGGSTSCCCCQVDECERDLSEAKQYYKRHRVCEQHAEAAVVFSKGTLQRFCQQCSKFHALSEFDDEKRSCRERLASHNERRRLRSAVQEMRAKGVDGGGVGTKLITEKTCKK